MMLDGWIGKAGTLPETNSHFAPENRPKPQKETRKSSNHPFSGAKMLVSGRVLSEMAKYEAKTARICQEIKIKDVFRNKDQFD